MVIAAIGLLLLAGCASKRVYRQPTTEAVEEAPAATTEVTPPRPAGPADAVALGIRVANLAREQIGRPYRWGGDSPGEGFDCSGLVHWSYGCVGIGMPRVVSGQHGMGRSIGGDQLQPGDLVFFAANGGGTDHVGIYVGGGEFVHAPSAGQPVRADSIDDGWWRGRWTDSRRVIGR
jgi:cell wall-associated NlpC family hydrolase